jgi:crotonobetainyl-CoA hydratase
MADFNSIRGAATFEFIEAELSDGIVTLTINRPTVHNALHKHACAEMGRVLDWCEAADDVRVVVVTGAGERAFCAGFDLQYAEAHPEVYKEVEFGSELVRRLDRLKPLIAAVNGIALGFGFELALACDLIIASDKAKFGLPEPMVGLAAMGGGVVRLTREIGTKRALGLILTAKQVSAQQGYELGFVNEVTTEPVLVTARRWAEAAAQGAPLSIAASKEMAYRNFDLPDLATALDPRSYPTVMRVAASEDAQEGRRAFLQRRKPLWQGR